VLSCSECKEHLYPEDPTIRTPRWINGKMIRYASPSNCEICNKPTYYRELEKEEKPQSQEVIHRHSDMSKEEFRRLDENTRSIKYLLGKIEELEKRKHGTY